MFYVHLFRAFVLLHSKSVMQTENKLALCAHIYSICACIYKSKCLLLDQHISQQSSLIQYGLVFTENIRKENNTVRILLQTKTLCSAPSIIKNYPCTILSLYALSWFCAHPFFNFPMQLLGTAHCTLSDFLKTPI